MKKDSTNMDASPKNGQDKKMLFLGGVVVLALVAISIFGGPFMKGLFTFGNVTTYGDLGIALNTNEAALANTYSVTATIDSITMDDSSIERIEQLNAIIQFDPDEIIVVDSNGGRLSTKILGEVSLKISETAGNGLYSGDLVMINETWGESQNDVVHFQLNEGVQTSVLSIVDTRTDNAYIAFGGTVQNPEDPELDQTGPAISLESSENTLGTANTAPTITSIEDQEIPQNTSALINFIVGDDITELDSLDITGSSNNTTLVPSANIRFGGLGANRTVNISPVVGQVGTAEITITVTDDSVPVLAEQEKFVLTVLPGTTPNQPPTITAIEDQITEVNTPISVPFTIGDDTTLISDLEIKTGSTNNTLVPDTNMVFGFSAGATKTLTITPATDETGTTEITVHVKDDSEPALSTDETFVLTVEINPVTQAPTATLTATPVSGAMPLLVVFDGSASTDPDGEIVEYAWNFGDGTFPGQGFEATSIVEHTYNSEGEYTAQLTVTDDDGETDFDTIKITVVPIGTPNQAPTITSIGDQTINMNSLVDVTFTIGDDLTLLENLELKGSSDNQTLVPSGTALAFSGIGAERTLKITPVTDETGTAEITVQVKDDGDPSLTAETTFTLTVNPILVPITDLSGYLFHDADGNGEKDAGEAVIANATIDMYLGSMNNGGTAEASTLTDENGYYEFDNITTSLSTRYLLVDTEGLDGFYTNRSHVSEDTNSNNDPKVVFIFNGTSLDMDIPMYSMDLNIDGFVLGNDVLSIAQTVLTPPDGMDLYNVDYNDIKKEMDLNYNFSVLGDDVLSIAQKVLSGE